MESSTWPEAMKNMKPLQLLHGVASRRIVRLAQRVYALIYDVYVAAFVLNISACRHRWRGLSAEEQMTLKFIWRPPAPNLSQLPAFVNMQQFFPLEEREEIKKKIVSVLILSAPEATEDLY